MQPESINQISDFTPQAAERALSTDIDPMTLARLDIGLFRYLYQLGNSPQQLCSIFLLSGEEFNYVLSLIRGPGQAAEGFAAVA